MSSTLSRPKLARPIMRSGLTLDDLLGRYLSVAVVVEPSGVPRVVPDDPEDDQVLSSALAAQVEMIVSGDKHLLGLGGHYQNIAIGTPAKGSNSLAYT